MTTLDHIALIVSSEATLDFYKKLGFAEFKRIPRVNDTVVFLKCGDITLEVFIDPSHPERQNYPETMGLRHLAFKVRSFAELRQGNVGQGSVIPENASQEKTTQDGIDIPQESVHKDWFGRNSVMLKDPDGQIVELVEER